MDKIIIGYEKGAYYGQSVIEYLIKFIYDEVIWTNNNKDNVDIMVQSNNGTLWNQKKKKYLYWSGESYEPIKNKNATHELWISTTLLFNDHMYIPYVLYSPYLYKERKYTNNQRKYFLAYCSSHKVKEREDFFNKCYSLSQKNNLLCHSLGKCYGNIPQSNKKVKGIWSDECLIDAYKDYTFVMAFENGVVDGYITEKILNVFYSGAIPVYHGNTNVSEFFNPKSFINVSNYNSYEDCINYMLNLTNEQITNMVNEPIYQSNNDIIQLLNTTRPNNTRNVYINQLKDFLQK